MGNNGFIYETWTSGTSGGTSGTRIILVPQKAEQAEQDPRTVPPLVPSVFPRVSSQKSQCGTSGTKNY